MNLTNTFNFMSSQQFGFTERDAGYVFMAQNVSYCATTLFIGWLIDAHPRHLYHVMVVGFILASLGGLLVGPADFLTRLLTPYVLIGCETQIH
jgi:MFS family permease